MKEQVLESPFCKKEFLELVDILSEEKTTKLANYAISDSTIVNIGDRDFVDYRPDISIKSEILKDKNITNIIFDSLHFFQVQKLVEEIDTKSVKIKKSDVTVNLILPKTYEDYLKSLTKKNRHELRRKKRKFDDETISCELRESRSQDIFDIFISQHKESKGEKGKFMTEVVETYFRNLLNMEGWKIYYTNTDKGVLSTAFCYENESGCYLYNSSRNNQFNSINPGIVLNDLIIQQLIERGMAFFDFLKGTERYKYDLGGNSVQLYDLIIEL